VVTIVAESSSSQSKVDAPERSMVRHRNGAFVGMVRHRNGAFVGMVRHRNGAFVGMEVAGYLAVLATTTCWATSGIFVQFVVADSDVSALALAFWRDLFTFLVLLVGVGALRPDLLRVRRRDLSWLIGMGASLGTFHVFWNLGVLLNGAAVATVQQAAMPIIVAVVAWVIWREPLTWNKILAIVLTFVGTVLVSGLYVADADIADADVRSQAELTLAGLLAGMGIPFTYAAWTLFAKKAREQYGPLTILTFGFGFGALALFPFQFFTPQPWPVPGLSWLWFAGLIAISTILPFTLYTFGLGRLPASVVSILAMTEIPIVAVYAYFILGERMSADQILGSVLVVGGILLLSRRGRQT
jgi:DME family drug/metabolite transporter